MRFGKRAAVATDLPTELAGCRAAAAGESVAGAAGPPDKISSGVTHATHPRPKVQRAHRKGQGELACIPDVYESKRELAGEARRLLESIQSFRLARKERRHSMSKVRCTRRVAGRGYLFIALFMSSAPAYGQKYEITTLIGGAFGAP